MSQKFVGQISPIFALAMALASCGESENAAVAPTEEATPTAANEGEHLTPEQTWANEWEEANVYYKASVFTISDNVRLNPDQRAALSFDEDRYGPWHFELGGEGGVQVFVEGGEAQISVSGAVFTLGRNEDDSRVKFEVNEDVTITGRFVDVFDKFSFSISDKKHPAVDNFPGVNVFPYNEDFIIEGQVVELDEAIEVEYDTSLGLKRKYMQVANWVAEKDGVELVLPLLAQTADYKAEGEVSTWLTDETTGAETYGTGRYLDAFPLEDIEEGMLTINFNNAYNPTCALSPHFDCPYVHSAHLALRVEAGEMVPTKLPNDHP